MNPSDFVQIAAFAVFAVAGAALSIIDVRTRRLPNPIVLAALAAGVVLLGAASVLSGRSDDLLRALAGMAILFVGYLALRIVSRGSLGGGDVKLAAVVGLHLGWVGWDALVVGSAAAFLVAGLVAVVLLAARRITARSHLAFGPWMIAGAWIGIALVPAAL